MWVLVTIEEEIINTNNKIKDDIRW
jgi:hypothetical protein